MSTIHFQTVVGPEQVIRPPTGINLLEGPIEVVVITAEESQDLANRPATTREWLLGLATESEGIGPSLPADLAEHHDHYAHGKPPRATGILPVLC